MKPIFQIILINILTILVLVPSMAQEKYQLKNSEISFYSEAPLENIEAKNNESKGIIDFSSNNFSLRIPIKSFVFDKNLMQQHFNENYLESDKYPNASFKGSIEGIYDIEKNGNYQVTASGELEIHGVKKQRKIPVIIEVKGKDIKIQSKFIVMLVDHQIDIPTIVFNKIAEKIEVSVKSDLQKL
jgi:hypothetical protein